MGDIFYTILILLPLFFWLAVFLFVIYLIVRWVKNKIRTAVEPLYEQLADSKQQTELLSKELEEVKIRLRKVETNLNDTE